MIYTVTKSIIQQQYVLYNRLCYISISYNNKIIAFKQRNGFVKYHGYDVIVLTGVKMKTVYLYLFL